MLHRTLDLERTMNPLDKIAGTLITGVVLALVLVVVLGSPQGFNFDVVLRWLHIAAGIAWIGLLYYFNFVQAPGLAEAAADKGGPGGAGVTKYIAPRALLWFRWSALVTWVTGAWYLLNKGWLLGAFTLGLAGQAGPFNNAIGIGAWLGTIMLFNVWVLIWPNQKKILGLTPATDEEKARARRIAFLASRTNTALSIPMILFMAASAHGLPF
ncbi:MAG: urate hydroxylase PuuD [Nevskiaceae bacterium]